MIYTTPDKIARLLRGRLEVASTSHGVNFGSSFGANQVDLELLEHRGSQIEAQINSILNMVYVLPIPETARDALLIVGSIVEDLTVAAIATIHFQQTLTPQMGGDMGFGQTLYAQALGRLRQYVAGYQFDLNVPGLPPVMANPMNPIQPIKLPDVPLRGFLPDTISRNYTSVQQRTESAAHKINWG